MHAEGCRGGLKVNVRQFFCVAVLAPTRPLCGPATGVRHCNCTIHSAPQLALAPTGRPHVHQRLHKITLVRNTLHRSSKIKLLLVLIVVVLLLLPPVKVEVLTIGQG